MLKHYKPGQVEVSFYSSGVGVTMPGELLGDVNVVIEEGEVTTTTQAHNYREGDGKLNARVTAMMFFPDASYLGKILQSRHNAAVDPADPGNIIGKAGQVAGQDTGVLHIHPVKEENDKHDFHLYLAEARTNSEPTFGADRGALGVEMIFEGQPDSNGNIYRDGTGDLTQDVVYEPITGTYTPVES